MVKILKADKPVYIRTKSEKEAIKRILGEFGSCFIWRETPQGHTYWSEVVDNLGLLLKESDQVNNRARDIAHAEIKEAHTKLKLLANDLKELIQTLESDKE